MRAWKKLGKIFDTKNFATSPRALVYEDKIRIYYSYRVPDKTKLLSKIAFVDFSKDFQKIIHQSTKEVFTRGNVGCYDEHGIKPFVPFRKNGKIFAFIGGMSRKESVSIDSAVGLAVSNDGGDTFERIGQGPFLAANQWEPYLIADPFLITENNIDHLFYIFGSKWEKKPNSDQYERFYRITQARSYDGLNWLRSGKYIIEGKSPDECQSTPTIVKIDDVYFCYFCYRNMFGFREGLDSSYRIGVATSTDLTTWKRQEDNFTISESGFDSEMVCYPHVFKIASSKNYNRIDDQIYMIYNGNNFGKYGIGLARLD